MDQEEGLRVDEDVRPIFDYLKDYRDYIDKRLANPDEIEGITTGIKELDTITGGFKEGELSVLAARTSIGKTSIALHMALEAAKLLNDHEYVYFFSLEMSANQLINRIISIKVNETVNTIIKNKNIVSQKYDIKEIRGKDNPTHYRNRVITGVCDRQNIGITTVSIKVH